MSLRFLGSRGRISSKRSATECAHNRRSPRTHHYWDWGYRVTGVDVEHTKAPTDAEIDADLVGDGGLYYDPDASYPEYGNGTVRWAYRLGVDAGAAAVPALVAAVERVQALHTPINAADYGVRNRGALVQVCTGCGQDDGNWQYWPCPTIRALEIK